MIFSLLSLALLQCPDISGEYNCDDDGESVPLIISTTQAGFSYQEGSDPRQSLSPDAGWIPWIDTEYVRDAKVKTECNGSNKPLQFSVDGILYQRGKPTNPIAYETFLKKTNTGSLVIRTRFLGSSDETLYFCTKK